MIPRIAVALLVATCPASAQAAVGCYKMARTHAEDELSPITVGPLTTAIPTRWESRAPDCPVGVYTDPASLDSIRAIPDLGEWDAEYSAVVEAAFGEIDLLAHYGWEPWPGGSFGDLQLRVYSADSSADAALEPLLRDGAEEAQRRVTGFGDFAMSESDLGEWRRVTLSIPVFFIDYGGTATVDAFATDCDGHALIVVFMYEGWEERGYGALVERIIEQSSCAGAA